MPAQLRNTADILRFIERCSDALSPPTHYDTDFLVCSFPRTLTHSLTHSLTHLCTHARTHSLTHRHTHSLTLSLLHRHTKSLTPAQTHSLTHSLTHPLSHAFTHTLRLVRCQHRYSLGKSTMPARSLSSACKHACRLCHMWPEALATTSRLRTSSALRFAGVFPLDGFRVCGVCICVGVDVDSPRVCWDCIWFLFWIANIFSPILVISIPRYLLGYDRTLTLKFYDQCKNSWIPYFNTTTHIVLR